MPLDRAQLIRRLGLAAAAAAVPGGLASEALAAGGGDFPNHPAWRFAVLSHLTTDPLFVALQYGADDGCALVGCSSSWDGSALGDANELAKAVSAAVASKVDGIALSIPNAKVLEASIARALQARVPVVTFNVNTAWAGGSRRLAFVGQDPRAAGSAIGVRIAKAVGRGDVALFVGDQAATGLRPLSDAVLAAIRATSSSVTARVVRTGADVYTQLGAVTDYYNAHRKLRGLFALDTGSTEGLNEAMDKLGLRALGVRAGGYGVLPATLKLIDEGKLDFTVDEQPYLQGFAAVLQLFLTKLSGGLVAASDVRVGPVFVTKANLKPYLMTRTRFEGSSSQQKYPIS
jgi:simple sugar transport system substrate-binding protein